VSDLPDDESEIFDAEQETGVLQKLLFPFLVLGFQEGVSQARKTVSADSVYTHAVRDYIQQWSFEKAHLITDATKNVLKEKLQAAIDNGDSVQAFAKTVRDTFDGFEVARSVTIARTEITGSIGYGATETLSDEGYPEKEWSAVGDERTRDAHDAADGQTVPIDQPFLVGGESLMFPGDPRGSPENVINCRCTPLGTGVPEDRKAHAIDMYLRAHGALERRLVVSLRRTFQAQRQRVLSRLTP
jgi:Phage Mu protein F like protein